MLSYVSSSQLMLLGVTITLKLLLVAVVLYRRLYHRYPIFSFYVVSLLAKSVTLGYSLRLSPAEYFWIYWICEAAVDAILLAAVMEVVVQQFWSRAPIFRWRHSLLSERAIIYFVFLVTIIIFLCALGHSSEDLTGSIIASLVALDKGCAKIACAVIGLASIWSAYFTVRWIPQGKSIAGGIAVMLCLSVVVIPSGQYFLGIVRTISVPFSQASEAAVLLYWIRALWRPAAVVKGAGNFVELVRLVEAGKSLEQQAEKMRGVA